MIPIEIDQETIISSLVRELKDDEIIKFVYDLDLIMEDARFSTKLVKKLLAGLICDVKLEEKEEIKREIMELF